MLLFDHENLFLYLTLYKSREYCRTPKLSTSDVSRTISYQFPLATASAHAY